MDYSIEYIEMCEKSKEIQSNEKIKFDLKFNGSLMNLYAKQDGNDKEIWLPRQDQLQEMIEDLDINGSFVSGIIDKNSDTGDFLTKIDEALYNYLNQLEKVSFEKLWLGFVMFHNYNKIWNSTIKQWIQIKGI